MKIENTELRMRVNELEAQLHDVTLKYDETKQRERWVKNQNQTCSTLLPRQRAKEQIEKIEREKKLQLEMATNQLTVSCGYYSRDWHPVFGIVANTRGVDATRKRQWEVATKNRQI